MWNGTENQIKCILIRHGRTRFNEEGRYLGRRDEPLSDRGIADILSAWHENIYGKVDVCLTSPLKRCIQTAELIWPGSEKVSVADFQEIDCGLWEGKTYRDLSGDPLYQQFIDSYAQIPFPQGEGREAFVRRVMRGWNQVVERIKACEWGQIDKLGMVVHGGTILAICSALWGGDYFSYQVPCGCGYTFWLNGQTGEIKEVEKIGG